MKLASFERLGYKKFLPAAAVLLAGNLLLGACTSDKDNPSVPCPSGPLKHGQEIPIENPKAYINLMRTPADGVDRNPGINWDGAKLFVKRRALESLVFNSVVVHHDGGGQQTSKDFILTDRDNDKIYELATVSGGPGPEMTPELSGTLERKLEQSLPSSCLATPAQKLRS